MSGRRGARAALVVLVVAVVALLLPAAAPVAAAGPSTPAAGPVVVVGVPGLRWADVDPRTTPALWRLVGRGAAGALSLRTAELAPCPADAWLALGSGERAAAPAPGGPSATCPAAAGLAAPEAGPDGGALLSEPGRTAVADPTGPGAARDEARAAAGAGRLAAGVRATGGCVTAVGPEAALAAAGPDGRVDVYVPDPAAAGDPAVLARCPVTVVAAPGTGRVPGGVAAADALVAAVDAARPAGSTLLVVATGQAPGADGPGAPALHAALEAGPETGAGRALVSASTRHPPYVQLVDVAPTVLARLGRDAPPAAPGQPWRATGEAAAPAERVAALRDAARLAAAHRRLAVPAAVVVIAVTVAVLAAAATVRRSDPARRARLATAATVAGALPVTTYLANLVPWWRADSPLLALLAATGAAALLVGGAASVGPWARHPLGPAGVVAGVTAAVLAADVGTGSRLQMASVLGHSPVVAGRFSGTSNLASGVLAAGVLLAAAALARALRSRPAGVRRAAAGGVVALGVLVAGVPGWGSDVGGVLALLPAGVLVVLAATGARLSWPRLLAAGGGAAAVVALLSAADALRPAAERTHLGRFAVQVVEGEAWAVVVRKAGANLDLLTANPATVAAPVLLAVAAVAVLRPRRVRAGRLADAYQRLPELRAGLVGVLTAGLLGALVNDSGVAVPAAAALVAVPLAVATVLRTPAPGSSPGGRAGRRTGGGGRERAAPVPAGGGRPRRAVTVDSRGRAGQPPGTTRAGSRPARTREVDSGPTRRPLA